MRERIQIGKIINTHGIKGEVKIIPLTDDIRRYDSVKTVYIEDLDERLSIDRVWYKKGFVFVKFEEYNNINDVIPFKNRYLLIDQKDAVDLPKDTFFIFEIIGLEVFSTSGERIGTVKDVLQTGGNDLYIVENNNKQHLIPAVKEIVKKIDIQGKMIIIEPIEGLIE